MSSETPWRQEKFNEDVAKFVPVLSRSLEKAQIVLNQLNRDHADMLFHRISYAKKKTATVKPPFHEHLPSDADGFCYYILIDFALRSKQQRELWIFPTFFCVASALNEDVLYLRTFNQNPFTGNKMCTAIIEKDQTFCPNKALKGQEYCIEHAPMEPNPQFITIKQKGIKVIKYLRRYLRPVVVTAKQPIHAYRWDETFALKIVRFLEYFSDLAENVETSYKNEKNRFCELSSPTYVIGNIQGDFYSMMRFLEERVNIRNFKYKPKTNILFLGDYIDRGQNQVEVLAMIFALKAIYPQQITILCGNHEVPGLHQKYQNEDFSFHLSAFPQYFGEEIREPKMAKESSEKINNLLKNAFACLPLVAVVNSFIFCAHGGMPDNRHFSKMKPLSAIGKFLKKDTSTLDKQDKILVETEIQERKNERPHPLKDDVIKDILTMDFLSMRETFTYSDPDLEGFSHFSYHHDNSSTKSVDFTAQREFFEQSGTTNIIRAHGSARDQTYLTSRVVTIFSNSSRFDEYSVIENSQMLSSLFALITQKSIHLFPYR